MFGSIYGPGVLNDTIVPGYGVTKFPVNLNTFWSLPNGTTRNFGEATQYVTYPMGHSSFEYALAQNLSSQNHISQWDPMMFSTGMDLTSNYGTNPYLTQEGQQAAYDWGRNLVIQQQIQSLIQGAANSLNAMESGLTSLAKSENLTAAQKATIQGLLEKVKAKKDEIAKQLKDKQPTEEEAKAIGKAIQDLQKQVSDAVGKIREQMSDGGNGGVTPDGSATGSQTGADAGTASDALAGTEYENIDPETGRANSIGAKRPDAEIEEFCATIDRSITGAGTDEETLKAAISGINAGNVVEIIKLWEETRGKHADNEGMFARIFKDLNDGEQKEVVPILLKALTDRAQALGIYDEIKQEVANINKELNYERTFWGFNWFGGQDDDVLKNNLMGIYNKIVKKEMANKNGAKKVINDRKTENDSKLSERKNQVVAEKRNEIANEIKKQLNLKDIPQLATGLKVETDDNGEFTGYSIVISTPNGRVKATGCTYQELALAIERNDLKVEDVLIRKAKA